MFENVVHLKGLSQLKSLVLEDTQVTDAGLKRLKGLTPTQMAGSLQHEGYRFWCQGIAICIAELFYSSRPAAVDRGAALCKVA